MEKSKEMGKHNGKPAIEGVGFRVLRLNEAWHWVHSSQGAIRGCGDEFFRVWDAV